MICMMVIVPSFIIPRALLCTARLSSSQLTASAYFVNGITVSAHEWPTAAFMAPKGQGSH